MECEVANLGDDVRSKTRLCSTCLTAEAKYTCPRCTVRTCSLRCCQAHKKSTVCSGKRDVAAFVARKDYNYFAFLSDYRFLESLDRDNENRERKMYEFYNIERKRKKTQSKLLNAVRSLKIDYRLSSSLFTRARLNRTYLTCDKPPTVLWTLELRLLDPSVGVSRGGEKPWRDSVLKPIHVLLHDCPCSSLLSDIWRSKVAELSSVELEALVAPQLATSSNVRVSTYVTNWVLALGKCIPYFYVECVDRQTKRVSKHEIFASSTSLLEVLTRDNYVVNEFPTIWVSQTGAAMGDSAVDEDIQKIIQLKGKTAASNQQKLLINAQIDALSKQIRRSELVTEEITSLPDGVNTYSSIGRMFIQKSIPDLVRDLSLQSEEYNRTIGSLKKKLDYVNKSLADAQQGLRDLISAKQQRM
ncbi:Box C/D snoRNA protein 1 [Taenia solium]